MKKQRSKQKKTPVVPIPGSHFRGMLWPRDTVNVKHRCIVIGLLLSDRPFDVPNQAIVNSEAELLRTAIDGLEFRENSTGLGTANDVICRLNSYPFVDE